MLLAGLLTAPSMILPWRGYVSSPVRFPGKIRSTLSAHPPCARWWPRCWPPTSTGGGAGRPVLAVTATTREAEDLAASLSDLIPADRARRGLGLGDPAARAAVPPQ